MGWAKCLEMPPKMNPKPCHNPNIFGNDFEPNPSVMSFLLMIPQKYLSLAQIKGIGRPIIRFSTAPNPL